MDRGERWIEGTFWRRARLEGNDVGYGSIVATGPHATTLHWVRNDGRVQPGDLALLDMGVEVDAFYTADVTRTLPIDGHFRDVQRQVYDVVLAAQQAGHRRHQAGRRLPRPAPGRHVGHRRRARGLGPARLAGGGIAAGRRRAAPPLHAAQHLAHAGPGRARLRQRARRDLSARARWPKAWCSPSSPGLYFQADDLTVPPEFRGIGVRIEDDVLVTGDGCRVLSDGAARARRDDVEEWVRELQS